MALELVADGPGRTVAIQLPFHPALGRRALMNRAISSHLERTSFSLDSITLALISVMWSSSPPKPTKTTSSWICTSTGNLTLAFSTNPAVSKVRMSRD